jgi:hypothetical protein
LGNQGNPLAKKVLKKGYWGKKVNLWGKKTYAIFFSPSNYFFLQRV